MGNGCKVKASILAAVKENYSAFLSICSPSEQPEEIQNTEAVARLRNQD